MALQMRYARGPAPGKVFVIRLQQCIARCNTLLQKSFFQDCKGGGQAGSPITYASIVVRIRSKAPAWAIANTVYVFSRLRIAVGRGTKNGSVTPFPGRLLPLAFKKQPPSCRPAEQRRGIWSSGAPAEGLHCGLPMTAAPNNRGRPPEPRNPSQYSARASSATSDR